MDKNRVYYLAV